MDKEIIKPFMEVVQIVAFMYKETTTTTELTNIVEAMVTEG